MTGSPLFVNVTGLHYSGSSAVKDLLREVDGVGVVENEFYTFAYGQLFDDLTNDAVMSSPKTRREIFSRHRYRAHIGNKTSIRGQHRLRKVFAKWGYYPLWLFVPRQGLAKFLGREYLQMCGEMFETLVNASSDPHRLLSTTRSAVQSIMELISSASTLGGCRVIVLDQFIKPAYIGCAKLFLPSVKHIIVTRDAKDHYCNFKPRIRAKMNVWKKAGLRPDGVEIDLSLSDLDFFVRSRQINESYVEALRKLHNDVLVVSFEDLIHHYSEVIQTVFDFLHIDKSLHKSPLQYLKPIESLANINYWQGKIDASEASKLDPLFAP